VQHSKIASPFSSRVITRIPPLGPYVSFRQLRTFGRVGDPLVKLAHLA
jgi:hypothetical protein